MKVFIRKRSSTEPHPSLFVFDRLPSSLLPSLKTKTKNKYNFCFYVKWTKWWVSRVSVQISFKKFYDNINQQELMSVATCYESNDMLFILLVDILFFYWKYFNVFNQNFWKYWILMLSCRYTYNNFFYISKNWVSISHQFGKIFSPPIKIDKKICFKKNI